MRKIGPNSVPVRQVTLILEQFGKVLLKGDTCFLKKTTVKLAQ